MIGAIEKQKFDGASVRRNGTWTHAIPVLHHFGRQVYILNRDSAARLTISSPLEAHKSKGPSSSSCKMLCKRRLSFLPVQASLVSRLHPCLRHGWHGCGIREPSLRQH